MITTRDINVDLSRERRPLNQKTTKEVNVYVKKGTPRPSKIAVTTHNIEDVQAIAEKKRRDEIIAQKKASASKILAETVEKGKEAIENLAADMKDKNEEEEKKIAMKERMAKARAARGKKK